MSAFLRLLWSGRHKPLDMQGRTAVENCKPLASGVHVQRKEPK